ncbi:MAG: DUF4340 domain-containing protein [Planctomycetota bacterium]
MNKITLFLVSVIVVLALFLLNYFVVDKHPPATSTAASHGMIFKELNAGAMTTISLKKGSVTIELVRKDKEWLMPLQKNRVAKIDRINKLLSDLESTYCSGQRTAKTLEPFELAPSNRVELVMEGNGKKTSLYIGKNIPETGSFVQRDSTSSVLEVDKFLATSAGVREDKGVTVLDPVFFYDLKIFSDSADDAIDVVIKKGNEVFRVQKVLPGKGPLVANQKLDKDDKPEWWITEPEGGPADESKVRNICSTMLNLTGKGYADELAEKDRGFDKSPAKIVIRLKDGAERSMTFGKIDNDDVLVSAIGKSDVFKVNKYVFDTCTKTDEIKKKEEKKEESAAPAPSVTPPAPVTPPKIDGPKVPVIPAPKK